MLKQPPMIPTHLTPHEIIGHSMGAFTDHCRSWWKRKGDTVSKENPMAARIITNLRENGFLVSGVDANGNLTFSVITRSKIQQIFEGPELEKLKRMTEKQVREQARSGFVRIAKDRHWQEVEQYEIESESVLF